MDTVAAFVADLARADVPPLVNQYRVEIPGLDVPGGAAVRCANLAEYLAARTRPHFALIGEAPSAHGARFSGIAFTSERSLPPERRTSAPGRRRDGFSEHSATVLRRVMDEVGLDPRDVVLWNVVPFHPARAEDPLRNRRPRRHEVELGMAWLSRFLALMAPLLVVAVGRTAAAVLPAGTRVVRHPANGGSRRLRADLEALGEVSVPRR